MASKSGNWNKSSKKWCRRWDFCTGRRRDQLRYRAEQIDLQRSELRKEKRREKWLQLIKNTLNNDYQLSSWTLQEDLLQLKAGHFYFCLRYQGWLFRQPDCPWNRPRAKSKRHSRFHHQKHFLLFERKVWKNWWPNLCKTINLEDLPQSPNPQEREELRLASHFLKKWIRFELKLHLLSLHCPASLKKLQDNPDVWDSYLITIYLLFLRKTTDWHNYWPSSQRRFDCFFYLRV